jgi:hypothetical protein
MQLTFRLLYYGELFPNTFYAKVIFSSITLVRGVWHLANFIMKGGFVVLLGLFAIRGNRPRLLPYLHQGYLLFLIYCIYLVIVGGDVPFWYRFYLPLLPLPFLGLAEGVARIAEHFNNKLHSRLFLGTTFIFLFSSFMLCWPHAEGKSIPYMRFGGVKNEGLVKLFLKKHAPEGSLVAASAVGMLGYYTSYRILDALGLNDKVIAHQKVKPLQKGWFGHDKSNWFYILSKLPDFIILQMGNKPVHLPGYDLCWPTQFIHDMAVYRRNFALKRQQLHLGMPAGQLRSIKQLPSCMRAPFRTLPKK